MNYVVYKMKSEIRHQILSHFYYGVYNPVRTFLLACPNLSVGGKGENGTKIYGAWPNPLAKFLKV